MICSSKPRDTDVLIVGAGPTGLVLALWLTRLGTRVRIIDKTAEPGTTSRALAVQARTLEFYEQMDLAAPVIEAGRWITAANLWRNGRRAAHIDFRNMGRGISPFPSPLVFPQDDHERLLVQRLAEAGIHVERNTELLRFDPTHDGVSARIRQPDGSEAACSASFLAGCDGARSTVRECLGIGFDGGTYEHLFYVADVEAQGPTINGELHAAFDRSDFLVTFPLRGPGRARLVGTVRQFPERSHHESSPQRELSWSDVSQGIVKDLSIHVARVNWFSTYRVHHRVASRFRSGPAFLLGDAAHIHSPVGGQGMNTGIGDAVNLAWKLAAVLGKRAPSILLDTYEPERIAFARRLVATTDRAFKGITSSSTFARVLRLDLAPMLVPAIFAFATTRRYLFRTISQTTINYRQSTLSEGRAGALHGGDRLPWVQLNPTSANQDNFASLKQMDWQVHVYGDLRPDLGEMCTRIGIGLHVFVWDRKMLHAGLRRHAAYLIRPDGYIALADTSGAGSTLAEYFTSRGLSPLSANGQHTRPARTPGA